MQVDLPLKIIGLGRYLPKRIVSNAEVEALCGLSAGWVERRNETVEKPKFRKPPPVRRSDFHRRQGRMG
jgi:hypothetical protein